MFIYLSFYIFIYIILFLNSKAPPKDLHELADFLRNTVRKEIPRDTIEFGAELGAGEFGAVFEGTLCILFAYRFAYRLIKDTAR
jgi:hypothetical protein